MGSSSTSTRWSASSERATASRARSPPETWRGTVAEAGVETLLETVQPDAETGPVECRDEILVAGVGAGQPDVLGQRGGEHVRVVVDQPDHTAYVVEGKAREVDAAETQRARRRGR